MRWAVLFTACLIVSGNTSLRYNIERLTVKDGLSSNVIYCTTQDHFGYLWIGSHDGLNCYDGYSFTNYNHDPFDEHSLSHNSVTDIVEDASHTLWVGTSDGLCWLEYDDREKGRFSRFDCGAVYKILQDSFGRFWVGSGKGLYVFNKHRALIRQINLGGPALVPDNAVIRLCEDHKTWLWVGTLKNGCFVFDLKSHPYKVLHHFKKEVGNANSLAGNAIRFIFEDSHKRLWVGAREGGLSLYQRETGHFKRIDCREQVTAGLRSNTLNYMFEDTNDRLWLVFNNGQIGVFDFESLSFRPLKLAGLFPEIDPLVINMYQDHSETIWLGTKSSGLLKFNPRIIHFNHQQLAKPGDPDVLRNVIWTFFEDDEGALYIGTNLGYSVIKYEQNGQRNIEHKQFLNEAGQPFKNQTVRDIEQDHTGNLWFATVANGVFKYNPETNRYKHYSKQEGANGGLQSNTIYGLLIDQSNTIWMATNGAGLVRFDTERERFRGYRFAGKPLYSDHDWIITIYESRDGHLWLGTWENGLIEYDPKRDTFSYYYRDSTNTNTMSNNTIFAIYEDSRGMLWLGSYGGGLIKFDRAKQTFTCYTIKQGLANNVIYGIQGDAFGRIWVSTNRGISRFDPESERFINFHVEDGLQDYEFNLGAAYRKSDGELLFGGINGFNRFYPKNITNNIAPKLAFERFDAGPDYKISGDSLNKSAGIVLPHHANAFSIRFLGLHFQASRFNRYVCKLEGWEEDWRNLGTKRAVTYTNLIPGEYTFKMKASNAHGIWSSQSRQLSIVINKPFWRQWWFILLVLIGLPSFWYLWYRNKIRQVIKVERAKSQMQENMRNDFYRDFHDNLGHRITKIALMTKLMENEIKQNHAIDGYTEKIKENADELYKDLREVLWELDPGEESLFELAVHLKNFSDDLFGKTDIAFRLIGLEERYKHIILPMDWRKQILRIFKEGMHNILKHAEGCKNVTLNIRMNDGFIKITLTDDGYGAVQVQDHGGNGVKNMKERAKSIGGTVVFDSSLKGKTSVIFSAKLP